MIPVLKASGGNGSRLNAFYVLLFFLGWTYGGHFGILGPLDIRSREL